MEIYNVNIQTYCAHQSLCLARKDRFAVYMQIIQWKLEKWHMFYGIRHMGFLRLLYRISMNKRESRIGTMPKNSRAFWKWGIALSFVSHVGFRVSLVLLFLIDQFLFGAKLTVKLPDKLVLHKIVYLHIKLLLIYSFVLHWNHKYIVQK